MALHGSFGEDGGATRRALSGYRILDLTDSRGAYCAKLLADMGAEVIKVEMPGTGDDSRAWGPPFVEGESAYFMSINRNKKSLTLNLKHPRGIEIFKSLVKAADVVLGQLPGTRDTPVPAAETVRRSHGDHCTDDPGGGGE